MSEQQERVAIVIGGASGIGAACAVALRDDGCRVVVADLPGTPCDVEVRAGSTRARERRANGEEVEERSLRPELARG